MATIIFNGKTYNSIEEMPPDARQAYEQVAGMLVDKNGNGIPDFLEGDMAHNVMTAFTSTINVNGKTYNNLDELPPELQAKVQGAFQKLSELGIATNNTPVIVQNQSAMTMQEPIVASTPMTSQSYTSVIQEDKGSGAIVWIIVGLVLVLCLAAAAIGVFLYLNN